VTTVTELRVHLHKPHAKQREFLDSPAKRKVIVAGRRGGKTTGASDLAVDALLQGRRVLEAAPKGDQTDAFWRLCKEAVAELTGAGIVYKNETERVLRMPDGAQIRAKTAWDADGLRGDYADLLILDEYSIMDPSAWNEVGAPMLLDNDGDAVFIFTPKRRNHAFHLYQPAISDDTGRWGAWHFTSLDNPYLSQDALEEITQDMTEAAYRQEVMAEFLENEGAVFRNLAACMHAPLDATPWDHRGHRIVAGVDWAQSIDYTAVSLVCVECRTEVARDRFQKIDYALQRARLEALCEKWGVHGVLPEANSMGVPIIEELEESGLPILTGPDKKLGFWTTSSSKPPLIRNLELAFENTEYQWQADPVWTGELEAYEANYSERTGRPRYGAPEGVHDDTVMARALAAWAAEQLRVYNKPGVHRYA